VATGKTAIWKTEILNAIGCDFDQIGINSYNLYSQLSFLQHLSDPIVRPSCAVLIHAQYQVTRRLHGPNLSKTPWRTHVLLTRYSVRTLDLCPCVIVFNLETAVSRFNGCACPDFKRQTAFQSQPQGLKP
jgi:hypothetical protein